MIDRIDPSAAAFPRAEPTARPQAMPDRYRVEGDPVATYRRYYATETATTDWAEWNDTDEPPWGDRYRLDGDRSGDDAGSANGD